MKYVANLLFLMMLTSNVFAHQAVEQDHVKVVGIGVVDQEPDQATLNITIESKEPNLLAAKKVADEKYTSVLKVIEASGISEKDIKATRIEANSVYEWKNNARIYKGERVSRSLAITINDLDKVSPLMQSIVESGVSSINGLQTGFKDLKALQNLALGAAADDARTKAEFLAKRLGRDLGDAYSITENNRGAGQPVFHEMASRMGANVAAMSAPAPREMFGSQKVEATVSVSFNLL